MITRQSAATANHDLGLGLSNMIGLVSCVTATGESDQAGGQSSVGAWLHLTGWAYGGSEQLYVNGQVVAANGVSGALMPSANPNRNDNR